MIVQIGLIPLTKFRPVGKRVKPQDLGITNPEGDRLDRATDESGVVRLEDAYDVPDEVIAEDNKTQTIVKYLDEKGLGEEKLYQKEYQLRVAHQVMINGGSTTQIAQKLDITPAAARKLRQELNARMINEVKTLDKNKVAGQALMFYDHVMAKALQIVNKQDKDDKQLRNKVEALKVALQAQTDKQKFLMGAGYWSSGLGNTGISDPHTDGANDLRDIMNAVLTGDSYEVVIDDDVELDDGIELM